MTCQAASSSEWLSPSRAWRLLKCPASVRCPGPGEEWVHPHESAETNAGTLAHNALEQWIRRKGYQAEDPKAVLADAADSCLAGLGAPAPPRWTLVRARLLARGAALTELVGARQSDEIVSETVLSDEVTRLRGTPDLVLLGPEMILLDLKTQTIRDNVPAWVAFQLNLYAYLVGTTYGKRPDSVEIFSLNRGRIPVDITDRTIQSALDALEVARASTGAEARPDPDVCFFCARRFACEAHWNTSAGWPDRDCVEGVIKRIEVAANGLAAVLIDEEMSQTWISGIPEQRIATGRTGDHIRCVRLQRTVATAEDKNAGWYWRKVSDLRLSQRRSSGAEPISVASG